MTFREYVEKNKETILSRIKQSKKEMIEDTNLSERNSSVDNLNVSGVWVWYNEKSDNACIENHPNLMIVWCCEAEPHWEDNLSSPSWSGHFWIPDSKDNKNSNLIIEVILLNREDISDLNDLENLRVFLRA